MAHKCPHVQPARYIIYIIYIRGIRVFKSLFSFAINAESISCHITCRSPSQVLNEYSGCVAQRPANVSGAAIGCAVIMELSTPSARDGADGDAEGTHNRQAGEA